ncbi:MAG: tetratricopeptide repeat protein, partial [Candidatus Bathyarchaeia archaeon]
MSDEAEVFELIRKLMRSQAGIITKLAPLLRQLNLSTEILDEHGDAISSLIEKLLGTREEHRQQRKRLEIIAGELADVKTRQESLGKHYQQLKKRLVKLESRPVQRLIYKLDEGKPFSSRDLESIESQIELHPDEEPLYVLKVRVLERMERTQDAQDWVEEALNRFPTSWELYFWRGNLIEDSPEKELESYSKSLECLQNGDETALHLVHFNKTVILLYDYRRLEEALVSASSSVEYLPSCEWGWTLKGVVLAELDRIPEALGCLDEALGLEESFALAWAAKASAVATLGPKYFEEAIEYFDKAIELDPENASTHLNRASVLAKQDKLDEALEGYSKGV